MLRRNDRNKFPLQNRTSRTAIPSSSARITTPFTGFDDLKGRTVGTQVGTKGVDLGTEAGATVKQYDANSQGWMELQSNTCDAVIINTSVALYYLKEGGDKDLKNRR